MKVNNEKILVQAFDKNGKVKNEFVVKNRITDLGLDALMYRMLPASVRDVIYPPATYGFDIEIIQWNNTAYLAIDTTQTITDGSTSMTYTAESEGLTTDTVTLNELSTNSEELISSFIFNPLIDWAEGIITGIGFGTEDLAGTIPYLYAYVDLSLANITTSFEDTSFYAFTRYDRAESNETSTEATYLPLRALSSDERAEISKITLCTMCDGGGDRFTYAVGDLTWTRLSAGIIEVTGFDNFLVGDVDLFPAEDLYPSDTLYPEQYGQIMSVEFQYLLTDDSTETPQTRYLTTTVNKEELDMSYNDTEFKLKLKIERGDY